MEWQGYVLLGMALALAVAAPVLVQAVRVGRLSRAGLDNVSRMTDEDMVLHMARLCGAMGYRVFRAPESEPAFDLILIDGLEQRRGVVVRHWRRRVDAPDVQTAADAAAHIENAEPMLVSLEGFTAKARAVAKQTGTILWSLPELTAAIGRVKQSAMAYPEVPMINVVPGRLPAAGQQAVVPLRSVLEAPAEHRQDPARQGGGPGEPRRRKRGERLRPGEVWEQDPTVAPKCPRCGRRMVARTTDGGEYWGCPTFPRCLGTRPKR